ncbi:MAG: MFS transporter [Bdellovibrionota bacterium]|nr:MAG: MFS transporter [Bdellovibrionota bacterium]
MATPRSAEMTNRTRAIAVLVAALGYFVDVYDLILFSVTRVASLRDLGFQGDELLHHGVYLLNMQMFGLLLGGVLWGVLGDKFGRVAVLFGSILLYSSANILNAFVYTIEGYGVLRLVAGIGLAGELGAGITLVSEIMPKETRGYATTIVASVGVAGAVAASLVGETFHWRTAYIIGGVMGFALLVLRILTHESGLFHEVTKKSVRRGDLLLLFRSRERVLRYLRCIMVGVPIWYVVGILFTFAPEIGAALEMPELPTAGKAVLFGYIGLVLGDLASGLLSQLLRSRKKALALFIFLTAVFSGLILSSHGMSTAYFYALCVPAGIAVGYWAVFVTSAAEQFGTNLRATAATTAPNFVRGFVVVLTSLFEFWKPSVGVVQSAFYVGVVAIGLAVISLIGLRESFGRDLDFIEE